MLNVHALLTLTVTPDKDAFMDDLRTAPLAAAITDFEAFLDKHQDIMGTTPWFEWVENTLEDMKRELARRLEKRGVHAPSRG